MMETRSAVYKMTRSAAREDRQIETWPPPFSSEMSPYREMEFGSLVRRACLANSLTLRISKAIVIGDVAVGKTSLVNRFCHKRFDNNYKATIGVDFEVERFDVLGIPFHLQIWDTAGQERFKCIAASYYRGADVIIVVFDLGNLISLGHCHQWLAEANQSNTGPCHVFLVGTKKDTLSRQVYGIIERRAAEVARKMTAEFWAVSARTGDGINEFFHRVAAISFNASAMRELNSIKMEPINIGRDLITLKRQSRIESKPKKVPKCPDCRIF